MEHPPQAVCAGEQAKLLDECHRTVSGKPETGADAEDVVLGGAPHGRHELVLLEQVKDASLIRVAYDNRVGGAGMAQRVEHDISRNASAEHACYFTTTLLPRRQRERAVRSRG